MITFKSLSMFLLAQCPVSGLIFEQYQQEITTFDDRDLWKASVDPSTMQLWCVDFNTFTTDVDLKLAPVSFEDNSITGSTRIMIEIIGVSTNTLNIVDAAPFVFDGVAAVDGTSYAALFVDGDEPPLTTKMTFSDGGVTAWGCDFELGAINEGLELELRFESGLTVDGFFSPSGFFGFTLETEFLESIHFKAPTQDGGSAGEGFGIDNVCGAVAKPEKEDLCFLRDIAVLGFIICFFFDIINSIFG